MIATASASELRTGGVEYWLTLDAERTGRVFSDFLPSVSSALLLYTGFKVAQFENQRWVRARSGGLRGTSLAFGLFVDLTGIVAMVFGYGWIVAYAFDTDWKQAVGLFAVAWLASFAIGMITSMCVALLRRAFESDNIRLVFWILGTFALWPLLMLLAGHVSWFGFL